MYKSTENLAITLFEHTCAYARWAHMHRFLSGVTRQKILEVNSYLERFDS